MNKHKARQWVKKLEEQGFDQSYYDQSHEYVHVSCSQCEALVINGIACHEPFCPNHKGD